MHIKSVLAFDIETVPDAELLRLSYSAPDVDDAEIIESARTAALEKSDGRSDFLPLTFHRVVALSYVNYTDDEVLIDSFSHPEQPEKEIVSDFFSLIEQQKPILVSWNGAGFDLPVLVMRALHHGVSTRGFWRGPGDKWHQYSSRFHDAHHDVMDLLSLRQQRASPKLTDIALSCGLPGKMGYGGDQVYPMFLEERHAEIRNYCETDALNTYLIWLRFSRSSGLLSPEDYRKLTAMVKECLADSPEAHLQKFLASWLG